VLAEEFEELQEASYHGHESLLDHYGATNPAEFFAVATETFFERPQQMARHHVELFELLQAYYRIDPRAWRDPPGDPPQSHQLAGARKGSAKAAKFLPGNSQSGVTHWRRKTRPHLRKSSGKRTRILSVRSRSR
jgi:Glucose-regulated metallo-peptidase M90